jgi:hypothetical protein
MLFDNLKREKVYKREGYLCFFWPDDRSSPVDTLFQKLGLWQRYMEVDGGRSEWVGIS